MPVSPALRTPRASWPALRCPGERGGAGTLNAAQAVTRMVFGGLALSLVMGCGGVDDQGGSDPVIATDPEVAAADGEWTSFEGSAPSMRALGEQVLEALVAGDTASLEGVRLTEAEHNEEVWPELPASAPEINFPVDYAWQNIDNRNRRGLNRLLPIFAGQDVTFHDVECRGQTEGFESFVVETDCWLLFAREDEQIWEVQAFKDVLVRAGGRKIFRYYDEEPRQTSGQLP